MTEGMILVLLEWWRLTHCCFHCDAGLLRLQQIYQSLRPGKESFQVESVKRIQNISEAIDYLHSLEELSRWVSPCHELASTGSL